MTPKQIIDAVALASGAKVERLCCVTKDEYGHCRYIAVHLIHKRVAGLTFADIAEACGYANPNVVRKAERYVASLRTTKGDALALFKLASAILDHEVHPINVNPIRLWKQSRVYFPTAQRQASSGKMPGAPKGWLLTEKAVEKLYQRRNYRGPVACGQEAVA